MNGITPLVSFIFKFASATPEARSTNTDVINSLRGIVFIISVPNDQALAPLGRG
jgi:hypothetical protein